MREDELRLLFSDVQSDVDTIFKVFKVSITKGIVFDVSDEFICCLKLSVRIGEFIGISNVGFITYKSI